MDRLLLSFIVLLATSIGTLAQDKGSVELQDLYSPKVPTISADGNGPLERFHGKLMFTENNRYLSANDVTNTFWKKYYNAQKLQYWGRYIWTLGLSYTASDLVFNMFDGRDNKILTDPSFIIGGVLTIIGGSMDFGGWSKLGKLADTYNSDPSVRRSYSLNFGPTKSGGVGLSLNF